MIKVWFSVLIYQPFKAFKEAMIVCNNNKIRNLKIDHILGVLEVIIMKLDYIFAPFVLFFVR